VVAGQLQPRLSQVDGDDAIGPLEPRPHDCVESDHPTPNTTTVEPDSTGVRNIAAASPVERPQANRQAASGGASGDTLASAISGITVASANVETMVDRLILAAWPTGWGETAAAFAIVTGHESDRLSRWSVSVLLRQFRLFFCSRETRLHIHVQSPDGEASIWLEPEIELARQLRAQRPELESLLELVIEHSRRFAMPGTGTSTVEVTNTSSVPLV
jgi:hypothetical protein